MVESMISLASTPNTCVSVAVSVECVRNLINVHTVHVRWTVDIQKSLACSRRNGPKLRQIREKLGTQGVRKFGTHFYVCMIYVLHSLLGRVESHT